jgi:hypothetical protein
MTNHLVDLEGDRASTTSYVQVLNLGMGGLYRCRRRRTEADWRIEHLDLEERTFSEVADVLRGPSRAIGGVEI